MKTTHFGIGITVVGATIGIAGLFKGMVIGYYLEEGIWIALALICGAILIWFGNKVHAVGKMASNGEDKISSVTDIAVVLKCAINNTFSKERRGNIEDRFDRHQISTYTDAPLEAIVSMADNAATKAAPMGGKFVRETIKTSGNASSAIYSVRTGPLGTVRGVFSVSYVIQADGKHALVKVEVEEVERKRNAIFGVIPIGPVTSVAVVPFENFTNIFKNSLESAATA